MNNTIVNRKFSISLSEDLVRFLADYQKEFKISNRSEVIAKGLEKLREEYLAKAYQEHAIEWQNDPDREFWDSAATDDGIDIEDVDW